MLRRALLSTLCVLFLASTVWSQIRHSEIRTGIWRGRRVTYNWVIGKNGRGQAIYQGDILLEHVQESPVSPGVDSFGIAYSQYLWPKVSGVAQVPYIIDVASGGVENIQAAITQFNSTFAG